MVGRRAPSHHGMDAAHRGGPPRSATSPGRGRIGHCPRHKLSPRRHPGNRDRPHRPLRLGRRLPRGDRPAPRNPRRTPRAGRRAPAVLRRQWTSPRTRLGRSLRRVLAWQEHDGDPSGAGDLVFPLDHSHHPRIRARPSPARPLRTLHPLLGCLPHPGDHRALPARRPPLPLLPHHRKQGAHSRGIPRGDGRPNFRL